jgi:hypothetical protein
MLAALRPRDDTLFVLWADAFPYQQLVLPLEPLPVPPSFKAVGLLWVTRTPLTARRLEEFGIDDLYKALYQRSDVLLLSNPIGNRILAAYLAKHYGVELRARAVFGHPALGGNQFYVLEGR